MDCATHSQQNLLHNCTKIARVKGRSRWMILQVAQDHPKWRYSMGVVTMLLSCSVFKILQILQLTLRPVTLGSHPFSMHQLKLKATHMYSVGPTLFDSCVNKLGVLGYCFMRRLVATNLQLHFNAHALRRNSYLLFRSFR